MGMVQNTAKVPHGNAAARDDIDRQDIRDMGDRSRPRAAREPGRAVQRDLGGHELAGPGIGLRHVIHARAADPVQVLPGILRPEHRDQHGERRGRAPVVPALDRGVPRRAVGEFPAADVRTRLEPLAPGAIVTALLSSPAAQLG